MNDAATVLAVGEQDMLDQSKKKLAEASEADRSVAQIIALRLLASQLEENLIPPEEAADVAQAHREAGDETWQRSVFGVLLGLWAAEAQGYRIRR